jgi:putative ABC transport system substrate-binding protein
MAISFARRKFIAGLGGMIVAWPLAAHAQQAVLPVIGYLSTRSPKDSADIVAAFREGLRESGYSEGQNAVIESRFAEGRYDRLPELATELVQRNVDVVVATGGTGSAVAAKKVVPPTIPIVFAMGGDPVNLGIVASLSHPGGNVTGITFLVNGLTDKQLQLLREIAPEAKVVGFLVNPKDPNLSSQLTQAQQAADVLRYKLVIADATTESELEQAFATFVQERVRALFIQVDPFFVDRRERIVVLAAQYSLPAIYALREFVEVGGLISYGTSITSANRQLGMYVGRVLKGEKPADLPVSQSTTFALVINLKTAKALGLTVPQTLLVAADEVIE